MNFSFEHALENVHNSKTKKYLSEVLQCYYSENFRSSVVMLYSVVICDLIFKLEELKDIYDDNTAKKILEEVQKIQNDEQEKTKWEYELVDKIFERTNLIEYSDYVNLNYLKKHRNLSAHPVLNTHFELYSPTKENTQSHISNMLNGVLTKNALLSSKVFNMFVSDISSLKEREMNDSELTKFLDSRYLKKVNIVVQKALFKKLWKLVFMLNNPDCNKNREINMRVLKILFKKDENEMLNLIEGEKVYFSKLNSEIDTRWINRFLFNFPSIYSVLDGDAITFIKSEIRKDSNKQVKAYYLSNSLEEHLDTIQTEMKKDKDFSFDMDTFNAYLEKTRGSQMFTKVTDLGILLFENSTSYREADDVYDKLIEPNIYEFTEEQLEQLLKVSNYNNQIYGRRNFKRNKDDFASLFRSILGEDYDFSVYSNLELEK